jgi:hypothetical protein
MNRRNLLAGLAASSMANLSSFAQTPGGAANSFLEIQTYRLHNSFEDQASRLSDFLRASRQPALARGGGKLIGAFKNEIGPDGPYFLTITQYASLAVFQEAIAKLVADETYQKELAALSSENGFPYVRIDSTLLRSFDGMPEAALADPNDKRPPRIFELRTYESHTQATLAKKIAMFNGGEIAIFQHVGMRPIFFGETLIGPRQPSLTYMLSFDDLGAREKLWHAFVTDPDWKKLSSRPGLSDAQIVSNISNVILGPLSFSMIR